MAKAAAALLPGLLPTPPRSTVAPCLVILPSSFASKPKPGRADAVDRWDAHKKPTSPASSCGSSSPGRASSCERWDINKKIPGSTTRSSSSSSSQGSNSALCENWGSSKRPPSRASSTDRWDTQKKARSAQAESRTSELEQEQEGQSRMDLVFSGSSFFASPEPSMLPMPTFFRSRGLGMMPMPAH
ncbi:unnamed protein product [Alopecurus aequalis]